MTFHTAGGFAEAEPFHDFEHAPIEPMGLNPLGGAFVDNVFPFILAEDFSEICGANDVAGFDQLHEALKNNQDIAEDSLLVGCDTTLEECHGETAADEARYSTGLYVLVNNMEAVCRQVNGDVLSDVITTYGVRERIVRAACGLLIFAQSPSAAPRTKLGGASCWLQAA